MDNGKVLLFRNEDQLHDKYHHCFKSSQLNLRVSSIPALDFEFINIDILSQQLMKWTEYEGGIFTSPRAVEALNITLNQIEKTHGDLLRSLKKSWSFFVVGKGTSQLLEEKGFHCMGKDTGNAEELAKYIRRYDQENSSMITENGGHEEPKIKKPFLFLCGNLAREVIPNALSQDGIPYETLCVYNTRQHPQFEDNLLIYCEKYGFPDVVVFFSPSGVSFFMDSLQKKFDDFRQVKVIAIGKTTGSALTEYNCRCDGISKKPTPESLLETVKMIL